MSKRWKLRQTQVPATNGAPPAPAAELAAPVPAVSFVLSAEEQARVREIQAGITNLKVIVADRLNERDQAEVVLQDAKQDVARAYEDWREYVAALVTVKGHDAKQGQWTLDPKTMTVTRVS